MSMTQDIMKILQKNSNRKGYVSNVDSDSLANDLRANRHDVIKFLGDMKKRGQIGYSMNSKGGGPAEGSTRIYRIRIRRSAMNGHHDESAEKAEPTEERVTLPIPVGFAHDDGTLTVDNPAEARMEVPLPVGDGAHTDYASHPRRNCQQVHPGMEHQDWFKSWADSFVDEVPVEHSTATPMVAEEEDSEAAQRPPSNSNIVSEQTPPRVRYPKIVALLDRKRLAEQASLNLEALGADDLAIKALDLVNAPLTPLQKEVAQFFVNHPEFVRFAMEEE